jgi:hypothetical protein
MSHAAVEERVTNPLDQNLPDLERAVLDALS